MSRKAVIYTRVSTDKQVQDGVSLDAQLNRCAQYAEMQDWEVISTFSDEGISAKSKEGRLGLQQALELVKKTKGVLVIYSLSRLSRSVLDTLTVVDELQSSKADLASVSENIDTAGPCGRFQLNVMSAMNQLEREQVSERTKLAMNHLKSTGKKFSRFAPYGFTYEKDKMIENKAEQKVIKLVKDMKAEGKKQKEILVTLEKKNIFNRNGNPFKQPQISKLLKS